MDTSLLLLKLFSGMCAFASLAVFVYWLMNSVNRFYESGVALRDVLRIPETLSLGRLPLMSQLQAVATSMLPAIDSYRRKEKFGAGMLLADWDRKLIQAGLRPQLSPEQLLAFSLMTGAAGTMVAGSLVFLLFGSVLGTFLFGILPGAIGGFKLPGIVLQHHIAERISFIEKRLPFAIEFMLLAMEARAAFQSAIEIYCNQMKDDPLADELRMVLRDITFNLSPQEALEGFAERVRSDAVSAFVVAVNTGLETGQPVQAVLTVQSDVCRERRYQAAETVAKTASTRAIFPLFITAMTVMLLLLGPVAIRVMKQSLF